MAKPGYVRVPVPHLDPVERVRGFDEVAIGYAPEQAVVEAQRCLQCYKPACEQGCPNHNPIKAFIGLIARGDPVAAARLLWERNALPSCTGRVCAWEEQCEGACPLGRKGDPIAIGALERFAAEQALALEVAQHGPMALGDLAESWTSPEDLRRLRGDVAVVGAGPAGLSAAHFLSRRGYSVVVLDSWVVPGGLLSYGIPEFVLPKRAVAEEIARIRRQGVRFVCNVRVGVDLTVDDLLNQGFKAVFVGTGANQASTMGVPGEELEGVWTAKDFLMRAALSGLDPEVSPPPVGRRVMVVGAGNTAMDAARTSLRLGAEQVVIAYRRAQEHSPSRPQEMALAREEGVAFEFLVAPVRFLGNESGRLAAAEMIRMRLGEPDSSGRPRPEPIEDSNYLTEVDTVVLAVGYRPELEVPRTTPGLKVHERWGTVVVESEAGLTSREGIFAGGDCVTGPKTVVHAVAAGRQAADGIHSLLAGLGGLPANGATSQPAAS